MFLFYQAGYRCFMLRYICLYLYIISGSYTLYLRFLSNFLEKTVFISLLLHSSSLH